MSETRESVTGKTVSSEFLAAVRAERLASLSRTEHLLEQAVGKLEDAGVHVCAAPQAEDALTYIDGLLDGLSAQRAVKSHSLTLEEIGLAQHLRSAGRHIDETRMELTGTETSLHAESGPGVPERIVSAIADAHIGFTGANAIVADIGTIALLEEEGNARLVSNLPPVHVCVAGIDKLFPATDEALAALRTASIFGTGKNMAAHLSFITGPSKTGDIGCRLISGMHGPGEVHVVLLDDGRTRALDEGLEELLLCVGCGACNAVPSARSSTGHEISPYLQPSCARRLLRHFVETVSPNEAGPPDTFPLPSRRSCEQGAEACPMRIPLDLLRDRILLTRGDTSA